jgi:uncharacterized protein (DUF3820 family)
VTFNEFNPVSEIVPAGKYEGCKWIEVPSDYLEWLGSKGASPDSRGKAKATLLYKKQIASQQSDPLDAAFGKKGGVK